MGIVAASVSPCVCVSAPADAPSLAFKEREWEGEDCHYVYLSDQKSSALLRAFQPLSQLPLEASWPLALGLRMCTLRQRMLTLTLIQKETIPE